MLPVTAAGGGALPPARRVLMTADAVGGVWTYALDLAAGLAARGVATTLAVLGPAPDGTQAAAAAAVPGLALRDTGLPPEWLAASPAEVEAAGRAVAAMAAEAGAEVVHLNGPALAGPGRFGVPVVGVCHSCVATWWRAVRGAGAPMPAEFGWRTALVARGLAAADALVAPTAAFARMTAEAYGLPRAPLVVHNGRRAAGAAAEGPPAEFVLAAGRLWDEGKDAATLDRAAARLAPVPVRAAGPTEGPNGARVALRHAQALGALAPTALARLYARRPVFAAPARYEPFGLAVLEAAQAGCALVLSDIPTFRETWDGAAAFVPPGDDAALADAPLALLRDPARRARAGADAQARARRFTVDAMADGMLGVYARARAAHPTTAEAAA